MSDHLWLHFTRMGGYDARPMIVRGDGCYLGTPTASATSTRSPGSSASTSATATARRSARRRRADARAALLHELVVRAPARARAERRRSPSLAPGDLNRVFFVSGGSEAVEAAWKLARQYHPARGERRWKAIARNVAYHGTTMGALSINGIPALRAPFEPLVPGVHHVRNTNRYHRPVEETEDEFTAFLLDELEHTIEAAGPETGRAGDHGAGAERRRLVHAARRATSRACAPSATATASCSAPTR